jgi:hypothetical protein
LINSIREKFFISILEENEELLIFKVSELKIKGTLLFRFLDKAKSKCILDPHIQI